MSLSPYNRWQILMKPDVVLCLLYVDVPVKLNKGNNGIIRCTNMSCVWWLCKQLSVLLSFYVQNRINVTISPNHEPNRVPVSLKAHRTRLLRWQNRLCIIVLYCIVNRSLRRLLVRYLTYRTDLSLQSLISSCIVELIVSIQHFWCATTSYPRMFVICGIA